MTDSYSVLDRYVLLIVTKLSRAYTALKSELGITTK